MTIYEIADGVRLVSVRTDKFKTSRISFTMATPLEGNISAKAILPYLLHRRCAEYPDFTAFNGMLDELYGAIVSASVSKVGENLLLSINMTAVDDRFALNGDKVTDECVELLTKLVFEPIVENGAFPEKIVEEEKRLLTEKLEAEQNDKRHYAFDRCEQIMFANEAYGKNRLGTAEEIASLTGRDVYLQWLDLLKSAKMQLTMVGSCEPDKVKDILTQKFAKIERSPAVKETEFFAGFPKPNYVCETLPVKQGKLVMGFRAGMRNEDDNVYPMKVAVDIFGGGTYSKLFSVVREKMSLCYYCSASLFAQKGVVMVQSGIENDNEEKAKSEILNQLKEVAEGNFSNETFSSSIKSLCDGRLSVNDIPESLCAWYTAQMMREELISPEEQVEKFKTVDKAQVIRAAKTIMLDTVYMLKGNAEGDDDDN